MNDLSIAPKLKRTERRLRAAIAYDLVDIQGAEFSMLIREAAKVRDEGHANHITFSRNVFIPLTQLCRDVCHYCTFAQVPSNTGKAFLSQEQVMEIARAGERAGCREVLFTLGDKPEMRYARTREELSTLGHETTISYLAEIAGLVMRETDLLVHVNPGVVTDEDIKLLRTVSVSQGLMLESTAERLCERGGPHFGSPDKHPAARLESLQLYGANKVPTTSGILIGIGETRHERIDALLALRRLNDRYGHIQEIIIQNFKPKPGTRMADVPEPALEELLWTIAVARLLFGPDMNIQAPPNLVRSAHTSLINAGINDWGGVSPLTPDHVNPEAPWPQLETLSERTAECGKILTERLAIYPAYIEHDGIWTDDKIIGNALRQADSTGLAREDGWFAGTSRDVPGISKSFLPTIVDGDIIAITKRAVTGDRLSPDEIVRLLEARGDDVTHILAAANDLRASVCGDEVTYVVNRNINYTNICLFHCSFCAFSKGRARDDLRDTPYVRGTDEVLRLAREAVDRGATEVCLQGGIHPSYTGQTYIDHAQAIHDALPELHIHGFSPLEVWHGAQSLGLSISEFLGRLQAAGLRTLPGTAAEILDDEVRAVICPDKLATEQWLEIIETAHGLGLKTTATIMFGHVEKPVHIARHLLHIRDLQERTRGFTEFVPLPFVHMEAPIALRNRSRRGPTYREAVLLHAVARLVLNPHLTNIQTSWVKMGIEGAKACLNAGCNDIGGVLMNESISRAAGADHGQELGKREMQELILSLGRQPVQRLTDYRAARPPNEVQREQAQMIDGRK